MVLISLNIIGTNKKLTDVKGPLLVVPFFGEFMKIVFLLLSLVLAFYTCPDKENKDAANGKQGVSQGVVADDTRKTIDEIVDCLRADFDSNGVNDFYRDMTIYSLHKNGLFKKVSILNFIQVNQSFIQATLFRAIVA